MKKKKIDTNLVLYFSKNFPMKELEQKRKKYRVFLGIGGNVGDTIKIFESFLMRIKNDTKLSLIQTSPLLKNPPFGYLNQNDFINGIIEISTDLHPLSLLRLTQKYEFIFGRKRSFKDAPRTLDIDIITITRNKRDIEFSDKNLIVPHKDSKNRQSVQIPLRLITQTKGKNGI